jgi:WD40 repeat protein
VAFSRDGSRVAIMGSTWPVVYVWTPGSPGVTTLRGHTSWVNSVRFSGDGQQVVTSSNDGTVRVWSADGTGEPLVLTGDAQTPALWAEFSPDRRRVLSVGAVRAGSDRPGPRLWTVSWSGLLDQLRERTAECLSASQRMQYLGEYFGNAAVRAAACERAAGGASGSR